jgi:hypothetical protein
MTIRTPTQLKALFETGDRPTATDFGDLIESTIRTRNVRPVEYFGAVGVDFGATPVNNLAAIQSAIDWSSATGGAVEFGYGVYGITGTLILKSHSILRGQGGHAGHTRIEQLSAGADVIVCVPVVGAAGGSSNCIVTGLVIDGGWTVNWDYALASKTQKGLWLNSPLSGAEDINRDNTVDTNHHIFDVWVRGVAGAAFYIEGRGEMMLSTLKASKCATDGIYLDSPDNWLSNFTASSCGNRGLVIGGGNQRIMNGKCWFIGMCQQEVEGVGIAFSDASGNKNVDGINLTTQDTWGPGIALNGQNIYITGRIDNAGGGRVEQYNGGYQGARSRPKHSLQFGNIKDSGGFIAIEGQSTHYTTGVLPSACSFRASGCDGNRFDLQMNKSNTTYLHSTLVDTNSGYNNAKKHNVVTLNGGLIHGSRTATELGDKTHSVNVFKSSGMVVLDSTNNRVLITTGNTDVAPWRTLDGTSVITPS